MASDGFAVSYSGCLHSVNSYRIWEGTQTLGFTLTLTPNTKQNSLAERTRSMHFNEEYEYAPPQPADNQCFSTQVGTNSPLLEHGASSRQIKKWEVVGKYQDE
jgi:hypothetical protein